MANETSAEQSDKTLDIAVRDVIPVCLRLCEPVCAESDYQITLSLFGSSIATVAIKGLTKLVNCEE